MKILTGNSNRPLAEAISAKLALPLVKANIRRFSDNEIFVEILENVRGEDVFVIQSTSFPANDHQMELLITIDALRRSSARRITAVIPYYGYARQDRRTGSRTPITAKLVANLITNAGANHVLTVDLHAAQIQGFFDIPLDNLYAGPVCNAAVALMDQGAKSVCAYVTHGVLSGSAVARVAASPMEKLVISDSIQPTEEVRVSPNVKPLSIASLLAEAMKRISEETS